MSVIELLGQMILLNGQQYIVTNEENAGPGTSTLFTHGGTITIQQYCRPVPLDAAFPTKHRNDRAYLKRKKGRS